MSEEIAIGIIGILFIFILAICPAKAQEKDYFYWEIGIGKNGNIIGASTPWNDAGGIGCSLGFGYVDQYTPRLQGKWHIIHHSQCDKGTPFTDDKESTLDHFGFSLIFRLGD